MKVKSISEIRNSGLKNGYVIGYASTWIREPDSYGDIVRIGAFSDFIREFERQGKVIPLLFNHDNGKMENFIGSVYHLQEDSKGLLFEAVYDDTMEGQRARQLVKDGRLWGVSFSYDVLDQGKVRLPDGRTVNELRKLNVHEISLCLYPANRDTSILESKEEKEARKRKILSRKAERVLMESEKYVKEYETMKLLKEVDRVLNS